MRTLRVGEGGPHGDDGAGTAAAAAAEGHTPVPLDRALACFVGAIPHPQEEWMVCSKVPFVAAEPSIVPAPS